MAGTVRTKTYKQLLDALVRARVDKGLSQADLGVRLGKPPSFVGKYELGERRLDVIEVFVVLKALAVEPIDFLRDNITDLPEKL